CIVTPDHVNRAEQNPLSVQRQPSGFGQAQAGYLQTRRMVRSASGRAASARVEIRLLAAAAQGSFGGGPPVVTEGRAGDTMTAKEAHANGKRTHARTR